MDKWEKLADKATIETTMAALKAYGVGSSVNKILIVNKEAQPSRMNLIFVNQLLGF